MKKSLLTVLSLVLASIAFDSSAKANGMTATQQESCRQVCQKKGDKWDPTSAASGKGCTCVTSDGDSYTITDPELGQKNLDNKLVK